MTDIGAVIRSRERHTQLIRRLIVLCIATALVGFGGWFIGVDAWHAAAAALVFAAVFLAFVLLPETFVPGWSDLPADSRDGARSEVSRLSWSLLMRSKEVRDSVLTRVENLARHRLERRKLDLDDPRDADAILRLVGQRAFSTIDPARSQAVSLAELVTCLNALDRLDDARLGALSPQASADPEKERAR